MQSEEQPVSDSSHPVKSNGGVNWPPSVFRIVLGAVIAACLSFIVLKTMYPIFEVPVEILSVPEQGPSWVYERLDNARYEVDGKNFAVVFGASGAILGVCCVLFSFGAKSFKAIAIAAIGTGCLGVTGAFLSNWMFNNMRLNSGKNSIIMGIPLDGMTQSIIGYSLLWSFIGLGVGVAIGAVRGFGKSLVAGVSGFVGGVLAAMIYVILIGQISIGTTMNRVLPDGNVGQAIWLLMFMVVVTVCIALGSGDKRPKNSAQKIAFGEQLK
jgi:hypothetical protein